ncbi:DUF5060 domain-containing protein [Portibacter marinus]|uniref:DUF5060 domain-containing protein n=1 Tax=Portibacter marinus TaxID=2898660 RepID=UPI001F460641|nr:DUF5060 domain-containing protein [Portibacter marinus]
MRSLLALGISLLFIPLYGQMVNPQITGKLKKWHKIELIFNGPEVDEMDEYNPFLNYRLDVTFLNGDERFTVPGFFAADGRAEESSATGGNIWKVRFTPNKEGEWKYSVSFKKGERAAVSKNLQELTSVRNLDGLSGVFEVGANDKTGLDNRAKGRLQYVGKPYLQYAESGEYFIKVGVDAPENLLGYEDFDAPTNVKGFLKSWQPHADDFPVDANAYTWKNGKGKNLMGAIHYLASEGLNVFSFLTFNVDGDDRNVYPYLLKVSTEEYEKYANVKDNLHSWDSLFYQTRLDVSKLEQWERIFAFAETRGMFLHFKTHETETDHLMDNGSFGDQTKLYYRELIARFSHHLALNWNLGEENNQPIEEVLKVAEYIQSIDPYHHHMVIHTFPNKDDRYASLIGDQSPLTGASLQLSHPDFIDVHDRVLKWRKASLDSGKPWALAVDEPGKANIALLPDDEDPEHHLARSNALWGTLMAGGYGVEWYFGYASPNSDLTCEDFRSRDKFWDQNKHALTFFKKHIPFYEMEPLDERTMDKKSYCFGKLGEIYVVYLMQDQKTTSIDLGDEGDKYAVQWYDPRKGGGLLNGNLTTINSNGFTNLGKAPYDELMDWVVLIKKVK